MRGLAAIPGRSGDARLLHAAISCAAWQQHAAAVLACAATVRRTLHLPMAVGGSNPCPGRGVNRGATGLWRGCRAVCMLSYLLLV